MTTSEKPLTLIFDPVLNREAWLKIWACQRFRDWSDAHIWLDFRYSAIANKLDRGFEVTFRSQEELAQFVLEWL